MPTWPEYLDLLDGYLTELGPELSGSARSTTARPMLGSSRPTAEMSAEEQVRALGVLAKLQQATVRGERRREELLEARRRLQLRASASSHRARVVAVDL